jgi:NAD(P)-dependent dehydrogenase (short-subunit alcohol dehydrogenase family)
MDLFDLTGKTALVTGASSGLGNRFARALSAAGARVIVAARRVDRLEALAKELKNVMVVDMDVTKKESVKAAFEEIEQAGEKIDICINNAGTGWHTGVFAEDNENMFEKIVQTNLMGVWYVTKAAASHMKNNHIEGSIINIASIAGGNVVIKYNAAYSASKAAVIHMTRTLVGELGAAKIRINAVLPGELTEYIFSDEEKRKEMEAQVPLHYLPETSDLDGTILFLASNKASRYVTGSTITVDGGASWGG